MAQLIMDYQLQEVAQQKMLRLMLKHENELIETRANNENLIKLNDSLQTNLKETTTRWGMLNTVIS